MFPFTPRQEVIRPLTLTLSAWRYLYILAARTIVNTPEQAHSVARVASYTEDTVKAYERAEGIVKNALRGTEIRLNAAIERLTNAERTQAQILAELEATRAAEESAEKQQKIDDLESRLGLEQKIIDSMNADIAEKQAAHVELLEGQKDLANHHFTLHFSEKTLAEIAHVAQAGLNSIKMENAHDGDCGVSGIPDAKAVSQIFHSLERAKISAQSEHTEETYNLSEDDFLSEDGKEIETNGAYPH